MRQSVISTKGRTIPAELRKKLGVAPGSSIIWRERTRPISANSLPGARPERLRVGPRRVTHRSRSGSDVAATSNCDGHATRFTTRRLFLFFLLLTTWSVQGHKSGGGAGNRQRPAPHRRADHIVHRTEYAKVSTTTRTRFRSRMERRS
jgi:hypothetical protein